MTSSARALAFLACPPADFARLAGCLRAAAPGARWDFVCFYPPPEDPGEGVRVLRPVRRVRFALALVARTLLAPYRSVWIAVEDLRRTDAVMPVIALSLLLRAGARSLIDRAGARRPLSAAWREPLGLVVAGALLPLARAITAIGLALVPSRAPSPRRGRTALLIPLLPDLSHTFVYREALELLRRHPDWEAYVLEAGDDRVVHREAAELALQAYPQLAQAVQANRKFLARAVRYLTGEAGIRQFLDIGTGIPAADNTHQVAQREAPDSRIVYVDNDPIVLLHAQALLKSTRQGACDYIQADLHDPDAILAGAARTLDFGQPVALMLLAILQFIPDEQDPVGLVSRLVAGLPPGSYLVISHPTDDFNPNRGESIKRYNERVADQATLRDQAGTAQFFAGLDLVEPGVVAVAKWRPDGDHLAAMPSSMWCGVARKP